MRDILPSTKITYLGSQCHEGWIDKWASLSPITLEDERYTIKNWFRLDDFLIDFEKEVYDPIGGKEILMLGVLAELLLELQWIGKGLLL